MLDAQHLQLPSPILEAVDAANRQDFDVFLSISDVSNAERRVLSVISLTSENRRGQVKGLSDNHTRLDMFRELSIDWHNVIHESQISGHVLSGRRTSRVSSLAT